MTDEREQQAQNALSDADIERLKRQRFQQRVERVMEVMREQRIDWRGIPYITPEGRIAVRVVPVEMDQPPRAP